MWQLHYIVSTDRISLLAHILWQARKSTVKRNMLLDLILMTDVILSITTPRESSLIKYLELGKTSSLTRAVPDVMSSNKTPSQLLLDVTCSYECKLLLLAIIHSFIHSANATRVLVIFAHQVNQSSWSQTESKQTSRSCQKVGRSGGRPKGFDKGCLLYVHTKWKRLLFKMVEGKDEGPWWDGEPGGRNCRHETVEMNLC